MNPSDNNSFGMPSAAGGQGMMAQPVAPRDTGDILLPGSEKKGGKKWLYAVLGVVAVVILVAVGAWMITRGDGGSSSTSGVTAQSLFNTYANYFLLGTDSESEIESDAQEFSESYIGKKIDSGEINRDELDKVRTYYDVFYNNYYQQVDDNEYFGELLNRYKSELNLITVYYSNENLTQVDVVRIFLENGEGSASNAMLEAYSKYEDIGDIHDLNYADIALDMWQNSIELAKIYNEMGCVVDKKVDYICAANRTNVTYDKVVSNISNDYSNIIMLINTSKDDVFSGIFEIDSEINYEVENDNETEE